MLSHREMQIWFPDNLQEVVGNSYPWALKQDNCFTVIILLLEEKKMRTGYAFVIFRVLKSHRFHRYNPIYSSYIYISRIRYCCDAKKSIITDPVIVR